MPPAETKSRMAIFVSRSLIYILLVSFEWVSSVEYACQISKPASNGSKVMIKVKVFRRVGQRSLSQTFCMKRPHRKEYTCKI